MTLLFYDGLQDPVLVPKPEYAGSTAWSSAQTGRDGQANGAGVLNNAQRILILPTSAATCIMGTAWWPNSQGAVGSSSNIVMAFCSALNTVQTCLFVNTSGFIEARRTSATGTLLGTSSGHAPILGLAWRHITGKVTLHTSTGTVAVQLDGVTVLTLTGQATSSVIGNVTHINMSAASGTSASCFWDDIYVCDGVDATATQGRPNNDFLGDLRVQCLFPTAAGDTTGWTPSTGANWAAVDENPANTTDFVSATATSTGTRDLYNLADLAGVVNLVYAVRVGLYAQKSDSGTGLIKPVIKENSVVTSQASQALSTTYGGVYGPPVAVKPSNSALWTAADVNALQAGVDVG